MQKGDTGREGTHKAFATADAHSHQDIRIALTRWWTSADMDDAVDTKDEDENKRQGQIKQEASGGGGEAAAAATTTRVQQSSQKESNWGGIRGLFQGENRVRDELWRGSATLKSTLRTEQTASPGGVPQPLALDYALDYACLTANNLGFWCRPFLSTSGVGWVGRGHRLTK